MFMINTNNLTKLEKYMYDKLSTEVETNINLRIVDAAAMCNVSPSKVSKFTQKLGFKNFKQFRFYFNGQQNEEKTEEKNERERLIQFLKNFDSKVIEEFLSIFKRYNKIILYGLGPSFISAEFFGYKLATVTNKNITITQQKDYVERLADDNTLLIVFSVTGKFSSFETLFKINRKHGATSLLILEEYTNNKHYNSDYIFYLTQSKQRDDLRPFEKTRTIFFIFIEEVITKLNVSKNI